MLNNPLLPVPAFFQRAHHLWGRFKALATPTVLVGVVIMVAGLVAVGLGGWAIFRATQQIKVVETELTQSSSPVVVTATAASETAPEVPQELVWVDVSGAVIHPGVYSLPSGSRISDAIATAGGFTKTADATFVSQELNLAKQLTDGQKLYIFTTADRKYQAELVFSNSLAETNLVQADTSQKSDQSGLLSINHATTSELEALPGIGPKRAEAIVAGRPYQRLAELTEKKVISQSLFDEIAGDISL